MISTRRWIYGLAILAGSVLPLQGCAQYDDRVRYFAEAHCENGEGLDRYDNPDGWDRCVEDNLEAAQTYADCRERENYDQAPSLSREASRIDELCEGEAGWF